MVFNNIFFPENGSKITVILSKGRCGRGQCKAIWAHFVNKKQSRRRKWREIALWFVDVCVKLSVGRCYERKTSKLKDLWRPYYFTETSYYVRTGVTIHASNKLFIYKFERPCILCVVTHNNTNHRKLASDDNPPKEETGLYSRWRWSYGRSWQTRRLWVAPSSPRRTIGVPTQGLSAAVDIPGHTAHVQRGAADRGERSPATGLPAARCRWSSGRAVRRELELGCGRRSCRVTLRRRWCWKLLLGTRT